MPSSERFSYCNTVRKFKIKGVFLMANNDLSSQVLQAVTELSHQLTRSEERLNNKMVAIEERLDNKMDAIEERLDNKMGAIEERLSARIDSLGNRVTTNEERLKQIHQKVDKFDAKLEVLSEGLLETQADVRMLKKSK